MARTVTAVDHEHHARLGNGYAVRLLLDNQDVRLAPLTERLLAKLLEHEKTFAMHKTGTLELNFSPKNVTCNMRAVLDIKD